VFLPRTLERVEHHEQVATPIDTRVEVYRRAPFSIYGLPESFTGLEPWRT